MTSRSLALTLATVAVAAVPAVGHAAQPKSRGLYLASENKDGERATIGVTGGLVTSATGQLRFTKNGKRCGSARAPRRPAPITGVASLNPGVKPSRKGSFSFSSTSPFEGANVVMRVRGRFTTSKRATVVVRATYNGCSAYYKGTKLTFRG